VFPPQRLECPDPAGCPVTPDLPRLKVAKMAPGTALYRVYDGTWGDDEHNPGFGDARFSPFDDLADGHRVPTMYVAATPVAALLETVSTRCTTAAAVSFIGVTSAESCLPI